MQLQLMPLCLCAMGTRGTCSKNTSLKNVFCNRACSLARNHLQNLFLHVIFFVDDSAIHLETITKLLQNS